METVYRNGRRGRAARGVLLGVVLVLVLAVSSGVAGAAARDKTAELRRERLQSKKSIISLAQRQAAAKRAADRLSAAGVSTKSLRPTQLDPQGIPNYFGTIPNYALSPLPLNAQGVYATQTADVVAGTGIRKFVDSLPGLGQSRANNLGQFMPVGVPDQSTYPGSDYYIIALVEYTEKMHTDLPATTLRGYVQLNAAGQQITPPHYLGPAIVSQKDRPVRIKFINQLPTGTGGDLFLPTDTTIMGAGAGPNGGSYTQNRATIHLHGGNSPWISDGTPHQWITPANENTPYPEGVSVRDVPDMATPEPGAMTFYYTNQQSARLLFYHDHAYGITRLNVYAGEAAPYVITDPVEQALINGGSFAANGQTVNVAAGTIPTETIPLVIQDKSFVPNDPQLIAQDPTWDKTAWGGLGSLWLPHVYMPNQNPSDPSGLNAMGRWDYGPWMGGMGTIPFAHGPVANPLAGQPGQNPTNPGVPNPSIAPEAFMDTPVINGTLYPYAKVGRKAYRFRILNAANDRFWNLQLYYATSNTIDSVDGQGNPTLQTASGEVPMVPAVPTPGFPADWPIDNRPEGVPDPAAVGPNMIQIASEGGLLPGPAELPNHPVDYVTDRRNATLGNVQNKTLLLGPAERADVIIDFSQVPAGSKIILYNDAPSPVPNFDVRYDYYTGAPDLTSVGGSPGTLAGYGPNTRTLMQFQVDGPAAPAFDTATLATVLPQAYAASQKKPLVPEAAYGSAFATSFANVYPGTTDKTITFTPFGAQSSVVMTMAPKLLFESFEMEYGRMNAQLGTFRDMTTPLTEPNIPFGYIDPPSEVIKDSRDVPMQQIGTAADGTQIWKILHGGVDTHAIHFHLFDVQVLNRVGIDNMQSPPDANELGWKDTVRMNPFQDVIVALRPTHQQLPWKLGDSIRLLDPTRPAGAMMGFSQYDVNGNPKMVMNELFNFGWEYVWHCHLLGHEENDMMRSVVFRVSPAKPTALSGQRSTLGTQVDLSWSNNATDPPATENLIQRATNAAFTSGVTTFSVPPGATSFSDPLVQAGITYYYRMRAENEAAYSEWSNPITVGASVTFVPVEGTNRFLTAVAASQRAFPATATTVVIAYGRNFPDALGGAALAGAYDGPMLLTEQNVIPTEVRNEITRLQATHAVIIGSTNVVSQAVEDDLATLVGGAGNVDRIAGPTRYETANAVATMTAEVSPQGGMATPGMTDDVFLAIGTNFPDALAASPAAYNKKWPILLTPATGLNQSTIAVLESMMVQRVHVLGSANAIPDSVLAQIPAGITVDRWQGPNRYATAVDIANRSGLSWSGLGIATGENFPDALAGGAMQGKLGGVLLLTPTNSLAPETSAAITAHSAEITEVRYLGSVVAVSQSVRDAIAALLP